MSVRSFIPLGRTQGRPWMARFGMLLLLAAILILASGCVPGQDRYTSDDPAGFFSGIWHGWIAPITLIWGLFGDVRIYEPVNSGWWYDLGFYMAIVGGFGGLTLTRKGRRRS